MADSLEGCEEVQDILKALRDFEACYADDYESIFPQINYNLATHFSSVYYDIISAETYYWMKDDFDYGALLGLNFYWLVKGH
mmetsp:Transcript_38315/g.28220  ORF Transcript_38315/g.28220 Transcript_38315/m.28220 type:complete len:82 (+) Transcript_38315:296-541(+)